MAKKRSVKDKEQKEESKEQILEESSGISQIKLNDISKDQSEKKEKSENNEKVMCIYHKERIVTENSNAARDLYNQSRYGTLNADGKVQLTLIESAYLLEKGRIIIQKNKSKNYISEEFLKFAQKTEPNFWVRYCVYRDIRNRGYIIKTAMKFGADFRVYDRGIKPGEDHAKWIVFPVHETSSLTWYEFSAKNRVAHSTKKRLLIGCVDEENDVTYWEIKWIRP